jgi:GDP/UDP-N,N'-diacetylbacillosamine 2-epimerase (hydrolysing)
MPRKSFSSAGVTPSPVTPGEGRGEGNSKLNSPHPIPPPEYQGRVKEVPARTICFVTGTRAEFGLMESTLRAIQKKCQLQIVVTGMHLSARHGKSVNAIRAAGRKIDAIVPWKDSNQTGALAESTGAAIAGLARAFAKLKPDIVLVVGDRVEAFAAASAAHLSGIIVAHVHGGDRALGQVDDSLRHAITKLAHIHFPATRQSAERIKKLGEQNWRIHRVGSPGIDGIVETARNIPRWPGEPFALIVLHPAGANDCQEFSRAQIVYRAAHVIFPKLIVIYPNNDPGSQGILRCWQSHAADEKSIFFPNVPRNVFLALLRDAAMLIGNSSSGIIEAASFGTPILDIGPRQQGREHGPNVIHVDYLAKAIQSAIKKVWHNGKRHRFPRSNVYGQGQTAERIAAKLASIPMNDQLHRKLIAY